MERPPNKILLHGFSYDFVFISGFLYGDRHVDEKVRAQAQGLLTVFTQGIAFMISSQLLAGYYFNRTVTDTENFSQWKDFWFLPIIYLMVVLVIFLCNRSGGVASWPSKNGLRVPRVGLSGLTRVVSTGKEGN
ncbi:MAG: hypothetical protein L3K26_14220 [Candidatus Hydrogenedentes bacterium]|nr:hypothetical protein [Candidatus Hydrogenedentota bacterium]